MLSIAGAASAGEKEEARRHFKAGMKAIENGDYDKGIAELKVAYDTLPHPNVLYNIARAYAESGDLESAIAYYRKYLAENPPDKDEIEPVLRNLEARLAKSKAAAAAAAAATSSTKTAPETKAVEAKTPETEPKAAAAVAPKGFADKELGSSKSEDVYEEKVVTASRAAQSPLDAPSSTYVITEQDIRLSGATQVPELLRRVIGIDFMQITANNFNLSIRGNNQRLSNKLLVLVDGRSIYLDFLGTTFWETVTIAVEDIERIEVVRGPGSALYGADAFSGVVNIITRAAGEGKNGVTGAVGSQKGGVLASQHGWIGLTGHAGRWNYRISASYENMPRWSREVAEGRVDLGYGKSNLDLGLQRTALDIRFTRDFTKDVRVGVGGGYGAGTFNFYGIGSFLDAIADARFGDFTGYVQGKHFGFRSFVNYVDAYPVFSQYYLGDLSARGHTYQRVWDNELTWTDRVKTGGLEHTLNVGLGYRFKSIRWNYLDKDYFAENHFNAFAQDAVQIGERWIVVASMRGDYVPFLERIIPSPRGAIIFKPSKGDAIHATVSSAFRKPSFLESYLNFPVPTPVSGAEAPTRGGNVAQEKILTAELGYQNQMSDYFSFDVAAYYNRISDIIALAATKSATPSAVAGGAGGYSENTGRYPAAFGSFENSCAAFDQYGAEAGIRTYPVTGLDVYASYALNQSRLDAPDGCTAFVGDKRTSQHKIIAGAQLRTKAGFDAGLDFFYYSGQTWAEQRINYATGNIEYVPFDLAGYAVLNGRIGYRFKGEPLDLAVGGTNLLNDVHREHPFGQLIGRKIYVSLGYRF